MISMEFIDFWHLKDMKNSRRSTQSSDRRRVYSSHVGRTADQDESIEMQLKEFGQPEPVLVHVVVKWLGLGQWCVVYCS